MKGSGASLLLDATQSLVNHGAEHGRMRSNAVKRRDQLLTEGPGDQAGTVRAQEDWDCWPISLLGDESRCLCADCVSLPLFWFLAHQQR